MYTETYTTKEIANLVIGNILVLKFGIEAGRYDTNSNMCYIIADVEDCLFVPAILSMLADGLEEDVMTGYTIGIYINRLRSKLANASRMVTKSLKGEC